MNMKNSALVLVDLQKGIIGMPTAPHSAAQVLANARALIDCFRANGGFIAFVRVSFVDGRDAVQTNAQRALPGKPDADFAEFAAELGVQAQDYVVNKRGFSAFFGTDLDLQLRRRKIEHIVWGGISTHIGVDSSARDAYQHAYKQYFVADMMSAPTAELHDFPLRHVFPLMGEVTDTAAMLRRLQP